MTCGCGNPSCAGPPACGSPPPPPRPLLPPAMPVRLLQPEAFRDLVGAVAGSFDTLAAFVATRIPAAVLRVSVGIGAGRHDCVRCAAPDPVEPWHHQTADGGWWAKDSAMPTTQMFGAAADGVTDDRAAILAADRYAAVRGVALWIIGPHVSSDGISRTAHWRGLGSPKLAPFPLYGDDKSFLRPGYKHLMPGSSIRFTGTGTRRVFTQRTDAFGTFTYCLRSARTGLTLHDVGLILDTDVFTAAGSLTTPDTDASAAYDVGHIIDDVARCLVAECDVFGYFPLAGTVVRSVAGNDDPDYTRFVGGSTMGRIGYAAIGSQGNDGASGGLSGTQSYGWNIFSNDHHSRSPAAAATIYANADTWRCLYIDGWTGATGAALNGHYFIGGCIRTYAIHPIELDQASQVFFDNVVIETSDYSGVPNAATKQLLASSNSYNVTFRSCRLSNSLGLLAAAFGGSLSGVLTIDACPGSGFGGGRITSEAKDGVANWIKVGGASGGTGDPAIQFGQGNASSSTAGWSLRRDISDASALVINWGGNVRLGLLATGGVRLPTFAVASLPDIAATPAGSVVYCPDGAGGAACLAVASAGAWKRIALGTTVSAT